MTDTSLGSLLVINFHFMGQFLNTYSGVITAIATLIIAAFTGTLWCTSRKQWRVSNKTLHLQFRPKLIVRNVVVNPTLDNDDVSLQRRESRNPRSREAGSFFAHR